MKSVALLLLCAPLAFGAVPPPVEQWQRGFGTIYAEQSGLAVKQSRDGGYIVGASQGDPRDSGQFWVLRLDAGGNLLWQQTGGSSDPEVEDYVVDVEETPDGGVVVLVESDSGLQTADMNKTDGAFGNEDFWVIRFDANGNQLWDHTFGASEQDEPHRIRAMPDGRFWLFGNFRDGTNGNRLSPTRGSSSWWFVGLDTNGQKVAEQSFGGSSYNEAASFTPVANGGFVLVGTSDSPASGNKTGTNFGNFDIWVVRVDASGSKLWDKSFGGSEADYGLDVWETNGTLVVAGYSYSGASGNKSNATSGVWLIGLGQDGQKLWERVLAADDMPYFPSVAPTADGGYLLAGTEFVSLADSNYRLVRTDTNGRLVWEISIGGNEWDILDRMIPTRDGGFLLAGKSVSGATGTKTVPNVGGSDVWLVKLRPDALNAPPSLRAVAQTANASKTNGFQFTLSGVASADYVIERSLEVFLWEAIATNRLAGSEELFIDHAATNLDRAIYRARVLP